MNETELFELLERVSKCKCEVRDAVDMLKHWPSETLDFACMDHHRTLRTGIPEVVYGENKNAEQIAVILKKLGRNNGVLMATRVSSEKAEAVLKDMPDLVYHEQARMLTGNLIDPGRGRGPIVVLSAGTSDIPVAEEAYITAECLGNEVEKVYDVGIAGIHRLLARRKLLASASVIIVVAGMEGALPSVVGGLVDRPVIAVPTSVGYGTGFGGIAALLAMLNSCAPGIAVVNIDNGFGAGCMASLINWK
ncbi:MAG: nickel pincer cofactor biosynthesis protein LarB [Thermodesulfobacteriota bacterium]|nr:nickel pincer cofactor biosynthesis protein LarB [Thermodesulfobacteriota bacterium]